MRKRVKAILNFIRSKFRNMSVKLFITYLILTIIPITIIELSVYNLWSDGERQNIINSNEKALTSAKNTLEYEFTKITKINMMFNTNNEIRGLITGISENTDSSQRKLDILKIQRFFNSTLLTVASIDSDIYSFTYFDRNKNMIFSNEFNIYDSPALDANSFKEIEAANGAPLIFDASEPLYNKWDKLNTISVAQLIKNPYDMQPMGIAMINYSFSMLKKTLTQLKYDDNSDILLVDKNGKVVFDTNTLFSGYKLSDVFMAKVEDLKNGYVAEEIKGVKYIVMGQNIEPYEWRVLGIYPQNRIAERIRLYLGEINIYLFLLVYVFAFITLLMFNKQIKPIHRIASLMYNNVENNFKIKIDPPKTSSEIEMLGNSFNLMTEKIDRLIKNEYIAKIKQREAEICALETQINPHFLYNTLETIRWAAVKENKDNIAEMIFALSSNMRYSLINTGEKVEIRDEVVWLKNYLYIQDIRFKGKFETTFEFDDAILDRKFYKLILQPFIENSILHGFRDIASGGILQVKGFCEGDTLVFEITDNGSGFSGGDREILIDQNSLDDIYGVGMGIYNAAKRVAMYYGKFEITIKSRTGFGTSVIIMIMPEES